MKKLLIVLISVLVVLASCTKSKEVHPELGDGNDEIVTVGMKDVHVKYTQTDHVELNRVVFHYGLAEVHQFDAAEMTKRETFFELALNDLVSDTLYDYCYELFYNSGETSITEQKTFHTQAYDTPTPPTPPTPPGGAPEGAISGLFTINENGDQVYFSQGNLQYRASTNTWRFAENQWNFVGDDTNGNVYVNGVKCDNSLVSPSYDGWIDLFNWGTSGYNHGANCYQPWSTSTNGADYYAYGIETCNLYDQTGKADWGYNSISNGGSQENLWRVLTYEEWRYVLFEREIPSFAKAWVNGVNGLIILPDNWNASFYSLNSVNDGNASYNQNIISFEDWQNNIECYGGVFLSCALNRAGTTVLYVSGDYWSSTRKMDKDFAYDICIRDYALEFSGDNGSLAQSVRLVQDAK